MCESWLFWPVIFCAVVGAYFIIVGIVLLLQVVYEGLKFNEWEFPDPILGLIWPLLFIIAICMGIDSLIIKVKNLFNNKKHDRVG